MESASEMVEQSVLAVPNILSIKPAQRTAEDVERLVSFLSEQPFFEGVSSASLELLSACLGIHQASTGEVILHVGELTDRLYVLLNGSCKIVRHSRREGFTPDQPQELAPGQALCEAALVVSGRRSDVGVTVTASEPSGLEAAADGGIGSAGTDGGTSGEAAGSRGGDGCCSGGGATLMVLTRTAWNNMCARAPTKPEYGEARLALLCCCARSLAASDPTARTLEQAEDLAALLRLLPGLSHTPAPVLRAMSESAYLRQLPPGTILFEECTRAESQFLVLAGAVETHTRPKRQGAANRAALRSALRSAVAAARGKSARGGPKSAGGPAPKTLRQKIEDERRAREQIKQSLALQREGLRTPKANSNRPTRARAVEEEFKKWMLEFLSRKRSGDNAANTAAATASVEGRSGRSALNRTVSIKAANAWRRAVNKALQTGGTATGPRVGGGAGARTTTERKDSTLLEYERMKMEEAGGLKDVGNLLGGAAARKAYMRGIATKDGGMYEEDEPESNGAAADAEASRSTKAGGVHWGPQEEDEAEGGEVQDVDEEEADPWVRLTFLDRRYQVVRKAIRYIDAVEKVMGVAKQESNDSSKALQGDGGGGGGQTAASGGGGGGDPDGDPDESRAADESQLLLLSDGDDATAAGSDSGGTGGAGSSAAAASAAASLAADEPGPDVTVDDACDEHLEQLYGPCGGQVEVGQVAGELPAMDRSKKNGQTRTRRTHSAIASPSGASVLVVVLEALRRGHEAARDGLVSERLAVLTALDPLRGLSDEHQAQLALGCTVVSLDTNQVIVRQGQLVDALFVVLEGEVRLLDDPDTTPTAAPPPQQPQQPSTGGVGNGGTTVSGASGAATNNGGSTAAAIPSDSSFRTVTAAAGGGKLMSLKIRRAAAALAALTLLGPGGSFGESVLGYPEDVAAAAAAAATTTTREPWEGDGGESTSTPSQYLATAMTSRPTKLLVMPRSLLVKYGYLRASLPSFANLRREAINGRRQQLQAGLQYLPGVALGLLPLPPPPPPLPAAGSTHGMPTPSSARRPANIPPPQRLMTPPSRPSEFLDSAVFRGLSTPRTTAVFGALNAAATAATASATAAVTPRGSGGVGEHADADAVVPASGPMGLGNVGIIGGSGGSIGNSPFPSLPLSERLKRFGTTRSGGGPFGAHWHFTDSHDAGGLVEEHVRLLSGELTVRTLRPLAEEQPAAAAELDAAAADGTFGLGLPFLSAAGVGGGGDALQAPPKPCAMRTSLTGVRQYGGTTIRPQLEMRSSSSGLPPLPTLSIGGGVSGVGRDLLNSPTGGGGANPPQPQRFTSQSQLMLRLDISPGEETVAAAATATAAAAGTASGTGDVESPQAHGSYGYPLPSPLQLSPTALSCSSGGGGATADLASPSGSNGGPHTPTAFPSLGGGGGGSGSGGASWSGGNGAESPQAFLASIAVGPGGGGGGGGSAFTAPLRGTLLPLGSGTWSPMVKRYSVTGTGTPSYTNNGNTSAGPQIDSQWQRVRESAPGTPLLAQSPYLQPQSQPQLNLLSPPAFSGAPGRSGSSLAGTLPYNNRLQGSGGGGSGGSRTTSQLDIFLAPTSHDGTALAATAPPLPRASFGGPTRTTYSRQAWRDAPEMSLSWDGAAAVQHGGGAVSSSGGGGSGGSSSMLIKGVSARSAKELALAALAANQPPDAHFLLVP